VSLLVHAIEMDTASRGGCKSATIVMFKDANYRNGKLFKLFWKCKHTNNFFTLKSCTFSIFVATSSDACTFVIKYGRVAMSSNWMLTQCKRELFFVIGRVEKCLSVKGTLSSSVKCTRRVPNVSIKRSRHKFCAPLF
jgi:hypothetical protein